MKYKIIGIVLTVCMLVGTFATYLVTEPEQGRYHQHISAKIQPECTDHGDEKFCTHLPLVQIDTHGQEIPGKTIRDENKVKIGYTTTPEGEDRIKASIKIFDSHEHRNHLDDAPELESGMTIHVRGNSSRSFDKSGYAIEFRDENDKRKDLSVMGMAAHSEWTLHGPFIDKTLMRNYMWYNIGGEIMDYAPNVRFCEVFVNDEYEGVYVMIEKITAGTNGARLNLSVDKKDNSYSGYLLQMDKTANNPDKKADTFTGYALRRKHEIEIMFPREGSLTPELKSSIEKDFSDFEKALYSYDFDSNEFGYKALIDVESFVDYFLINEFTCNYDAGWMSTFIYKDIDGKFRMCLWDFNSACDAYHHSYLNTEDFQFTDVLWYWMLIKDKDFVNRLIERYHELRQTYFSVEYLDNYIDGVIDYLGDAIDRNFDRWGYTFGVDYDKFTPQERNPRSYEDAVEAMRLFIHTRSENMDKNIESLRQFCAESRIKKFVENAN